MSDIAEEKSSLSSFGKQLSDDATYFSVPSDLTSEHDKSAALRSLSVHSVLESLERNTDQTLSESRLTSTGSSFESLENEPVIKEFVSLPLRSSSDIPDSDYKTCKEMLHDGENGKTRSSESIYFSAHSGPILSQMAQKLSQPSDDDETLREESRDKQSIKKFEEDTFSNKSATSALSSALSLGPMHKELSEEDINVVEKVALNTNKSSGTIEPDTKVAKLIDEKKLKVKLQTPNIVILDNLIEVEELKSKDNKIFYENASETCCEHNTACFAIAVIVPKVDHIDAEQENAENFFDDSKIIKQQASITEEAKLQNYILSVSAALVDEDIQDIESANEFNEESLTTFKVEKEIEEENPYDYSCGTSIPYSQNLEISFQEVEHSSYINALEHKTCQAGSTDEPQLCNSMATSTPQITDYHLSLEKIIDISHTSNNRKTENCDILIVNDEMSQIDKAIDTAVVTNFFNKLESIEELPSDCDSSNLCFAKGASEEILATEKLLTILSAYSNDTEESYEECIHFQSAESNKDLLTPECFSCEINLSKTIPVAVPIMTELFQDLESFNTYSKDQLEDSFLTVESIIEDSDYPKIALTISIPQSTNVYEQHEEVRVDQFLLNEPMQEASKLTEEEMSKNNEIELKATSTLFNLSENTEDTCSIHSTDNVEDDQYKTLHKTAKETMEEKNLQIAENLLIPQLTNLNQEEEHINVELVCISESSQAGAQELIEEDVSVTGLEIKAVGTIFSFSQDMEDTIDIQSTVKEELLKTADEKDEQRLTDIVEIIATAIIEETTIITDSISGHIIDKLDIGKASCATEDKSLTQNIAVCIPLIEDINDTTDQAKEVNSHVLDTTSRGIKSYEKNNLFSTADSVATGLLIDFNVNPESTESLIFKELDESIKKATYITEEEEKDNELKILQSPEILTAEIAKSDDILLTEKTEEISSELPSPTMHVNTEYKKSDFIESTSNKEEIEFLKTSYQEDASALQPKLEKLESTKHLEDFDDEVSSEMFNTSDKESEKIKAYQKTKMNMVLLIYFCLNSHETLTFILHQIS